MGCSAAEGRMADQQDVNEIQNTLIKTRIAPDLLGKLQSSPPSPTTPAQIPVLFAVIIEMYAAFPDGCKAARATLLRQFLKEQDSARVKVIDAALARRSLVGFRSPALPSTPGRLFDEHDTLSIANSLFTENYLFGEITQDTINRLGDLLIDMGGEKVPAIHKIWSDHQVERFVFDSIRTVKCDAARATFAAAGDGVVWAVADTGIDGSHPHFLTHKTLKAGHGLRHRDFTEVHATAAGASEAALVDTNGHGTHVAGIIAGETVATRSHRICIRRSIRTSDADNAPKEELTSRTSPISGLAPLCKILSLKVLRTGDKGQVSYLLAAIGYLQTINENGRHLRVHGLNLSLGYPFRPEWFAAGQSPLCVEIDRLVRSGVMVVVAAGNGGYGTVNTSQGRPESAAHGATIADPGNADLALTVGSTHRDMPHTYGVSYFSAKGPTADGRMKPDLVAPGERIVSCALMDDAARTNKFAPFREDSGTSMAAPHVSGAAAAFMSVRTEFIGQPQRIKEIFVGSATDLKRKPEYQGGGLIDVMRALQAV
jgi:subtilisin family serine protease